MAGYVSDPRERRGGGDPGRVDVSGDHLLVMLLLYVGAGRGDERDGYASLDSLREASGLGARRVWELVEELQEMDLVRCIWDARAPVMASPERDHPGRDGDGRFLQRTKAGLTAQGRSYPPLHEYLRLQDPEPRRTPLASRTPRPKIRHAVPEYPWEYHVYRPRASALRRLEALICALVLLVVAAFVALLVFF